MKHRRPNTFRPINLSPRLVLMLLALVISAALFCFNNRPLSLEESIKQFTADEGIKGGVVAISRNGKIEQVFAIGIQLNEARTPVTLDTRFPIASLTKVITASMVRSLVRHGHFRLDDHVASLLPQLAFNDPRFSQITVRHLLQHTAGLPASNAVDPMFSAAGQVTSCATAINIAGKRQLSSTPGDKIDYSNVGYCLLGLLISQNAKMNYQTAAINLVLKYYPEGSLSMGPIDDAEALRWPTRTAEEWRSLSSVGGWFSDARTLVNFFAADARWSDIASPPTAPYLHSYYGLGWRVWPTASGYDLTHTGVLPEAFSFAFGRRDGSAAVALFNGPVRDRDAATARLRSLLNQHL